MKKTVLVTYEVIVDVPEDKWEEILTDYRACISSGGTKQDVIEHIAWNATKGWDFCEGVGANGSDFEATIIDVDTEIQ